MILVVAGNHESYMKWRRRQTRRDTCGLLERTAHGCREVIRVSDLFEHPDCTTVVLLRDWNKHPAYESINKFVNSKHTYIVIPEGSKI